MKLALVLAFVGCSTMETARMTAPITFASDEDRYYATQAALLDPRCYHMVVSGGNALDVTVPDGHTWHVSNAFAVTYGTPQIVAQDLFPNSRRSGFIRPFDVRRGIMLPGGTRVKRNDDNANDAYLYYCDPDEVWSIDARYTTDPRGLHFGRLARLETLPLLSAVLEATGGGGIDDDVHLILPGTADILVTAASAFDVSWVTLGWTDDLAHPVNLLNEINNSHSLRTGEGLLSPMPRRTGLRLTLCKGSTSDQPNSTNPAIAYPIKGTGTLLYHALPTDW